ncbi:hypothetical protein P343_06135 [Sporolactobacillus laevolacticus DSM 442]|uniref:Uncharacterized protein n=1 Tax=Sporolactobacillus laevolacticus DSM 442 TaxID=1395513 RepID=V6J0V0_9BACL|nr:hypothetical protein P343_06135 [Sporolactobacillus laevolacticus DSM 442]
MTSAVTISKYLRKTYEQKSFENSSQMEIPIRTSTISTELNDMRIIKDFEDYLSQIGACEKKACK